MWTRVSCPVILCIALARPVLGQAPQTARRFAGPDTTTAVVTFGGGTLKAYVAVVDKAFGGSNVVIDTNVPEVVLPSAPLKKSVTLLSALQWVPRTRNAREVGLVLQPPQSSRAGDVFLFTSAVTARERARAQEHRQPWSFSFDEYRKRGDADTAVLKSAILDDINKLPSDTPATVTYNKTTGRMQVYGTVDQIRMARDVVESQTNSQRVARLLPALESKVDSLTKQVAALKARVDSLGKSKAKEQ